MSAATGAIAVAEVDRLRELASIGAGHAATALGSLVRRPIEMEVPAVRVMSANPMPAAVAAEGGSAICFHLMGGFTGVVAVVFSRGSLEVLVNEVMGADAYGLDRAVESAVRETGNILVSHFANAIADTLGTMVLPSVPLLTQPDDLGGWVNAVAGAAGLQIETPIFDRERELEGYLLLVPAADSLR